MLSNRYVINWTEYLYFHQCIFKLEETTSDSKTSKNHQRILAKGQEISEKILS